ncbi:redoxin domain-containing protein [SAR202 cluster bacterium AD-802-E10_MRT_200m]|nr:redoxin domain-containing protein [SAR202 cluster bacterium AD-802-E10_MRT_200m]
MAKLEIGTPAPDFTLQDCYGKTVTLNDFRGKKVLLFFYTSSGGNN